MAEFRLVDLWEYWKTLQDFEPPPTEVHQFWDEYHDLSSTVSLTPEAAKLKDLIDKFIVKSGYLYNPDPYKKITNRHFIALTKVEHPLEIAVKVKLILKEATLEVLSVVVKPTVKEPWQMTYYDFQLTRPPADKELPPLLSWFLEKGKPSTPFLGGETWSFYGKQPKGFFQLKDYLFRQHMGKGLPGEIPLRVKYLEGYKGTLGSYIVNRDWGDISIQPHRDGNLTIFVERSTFHYNKVKQAISEGKPVPPEVLKDYPDLAKGKAR